MGVLNYWASSSTDIFVFVVLFVCGMDTGSVWIIPAGLLYTAEFVLWCASTVNYHSLVLSLFSFNNSWQLKLVEGALETSMVLTGHFMFFLPSLCALPITLAMVEELFFLLILKPWCLKHMLNFYRYQNYCLRISTYYLRVYINVTLRFVSSLEM